jgi:hypothetical protein
MQSRRTGRVLEVKKTLVLDRAGGIGARGQRRYVLAREKFDPRAAAKTTHVTISR